MFLVVFWFFLWTLPPPRAAIKTSVATSRREVATDVLIAALGGEVGFVQVSRRLDCVFSCGYVILLCVSWHPLGILA